MPATVNFITAAEIGVVTAKDDDGNSCEFHELSHRRADGRECATGTRQGFWDFSLGKQEAAAWLVRHDPSHIAALQGCQPSKPPAL